MKIHLDTRIPAGTPRAGVLASADAATALTSSAAAQASWNAFWARSGKGWCTATDDGTDAYANLLPADPNTPEGAEKYRQAGAALAKLLQAARHNGVSLPNAHPALVEGLLLANYRYTDQFAQKKAENTPSLNAVYLEGWKASDVRALEIRIESVFLARTLINHPVNVLNAQGLAQAAADAGKEYGFHVEVFNKKKIESLKMGGLLGVNWGSLDEPTFTVLEYKPANAVNAQPYVLVGKGVVYDTGGLSLKPTNSMDTMKSDMSGAAAVIGAVSGAARLGLPVHVVGLIPATDNRPGGNAVTPGDVLTMSDGTTVEVLNTDAEGRLILADALHYAKRYNPQLVIDLATLTGAAARAIGHYATVAMGTASEEVWSDLLASGSRTHERLVRFPFWDDYNELLKSTVADLKNIGGADAGAITAGKFLEHFTDYPYVHLDIAGPAFADKPMGYWSAGGTGIGVRLLLDFLSTRTA